MKKRGKFIVIEGTDCSGKNVQTKLLTQRLNDEGIKTINTSFPKYDSPSGNMVGLYLGKHPSELHNPFFDITKMPHFGSWFGKNPQDVDPYVASCYYGANRRAHRKDITGPLDNGINVICDRYTTSNMGHQGGKYDNEEDREKFFMDLEQFEYGFLKLPRPDQVIFLHMPYESGMELKKGRPGEPDLHESDPDHLMRAEQSYMHLARFYNWITVDCASHINGKLARKPEDLVRTPEDIHEEVYSKVIGILKNNSTLPYNYNI